MTLTASSTALFLDVLGALIEKGVSARIDEIDVTAPQHFDAPDTVRFRVQRGMLAREVKTVLIDMGYEAVLMTPNETWHRRWAIVAFKDA